MSQTINLIENPEEDPLCPHCEKPLRTLNCKKIKGRISARYIYYCGRCRKTLGISDRKSFWMG